MLHTPPGIIPYRGADRKDDSRDKCPATLAPIPVTAYNEGMGYCTHCDYEYEAWATVCTDCGRPLTDIAPPALPPPPAPRRGEDPLVYLTNVPNAIMGNLLVNQLKGIGIPSLLRRSPAADIGEWSHNDFVMHDVLVPTSHLDEARTYIYSPPGTPYGSAARAGDEWQPLTFDPTAPGDRGPEPGDGWRALPTESEYIQQRTLRKTHGSGSVWDRPTRYDADDFDDEDGGRPDVTRSRWFRAIAGLLFLAASLPWILQLIQQATDWLRR